MARFEGGFGAWDLGVHVHGVIGQGIRFAFGEQRRGADCTHPLLQLQDPTPTLRIGVTHTQLAGRQGWEPWAPGVFFSFTEGTTKYIGF